jgi:hypothetical protein
MVYFSREAAWRANKINLHTLQLTRDVHYLYCGAEAPLPFDNWQDTSMIFFYKLNLLNKKVIKNTTRAKAFTYHL